MDKKILTIVLAIVLIGCFFLDWGGGVSGYDRVFNNAADKDWQKYIPLLIPLSGVLLLIGALNNGNYIGGRAIWTWLPLLTILFLIIISPLIASHPPGMPGVKIGDVFKGLGKGYGIGKWITIA